MTNISQEEMRVLLKSQQGELEGVIMYRALADVVKDPKDRETFSSLRSKKGMNGTVASPWRSREKRKQSIR